MIKRTIIDRKERQISVVVRRVRPKPAPPTAVVSARTT
jgi:hypothetical protein